MNNVTREQIQIARKADLYSYLLACHADTVRQSHNRLRHKDHDSLVVTPGKGYIHNSADQHGNAIDYLTNYLGYGFTDAVAALCAFQDKPIKADLQAPVSKISLPEASEGPYKRLYAYLLNRRIDRNLIDTLVRQHLLYQSVGDNNGVCVAPDFVETFGTLTYKRFKGVLPGSAYNGYWHFGSGPSCYVCESAIEAMSLATLRAENAVYCSLAGLKQSALERITNEYGNVILAVNNDEAGNNFAKANSYLPRVTPNLKDWNDEINKEK